MITIQLKSFSFLKGYPADFSGHGGGFVFDCRCIKNPGQISTLMALTGRDQEVSDYLMDETEMPEFLFETKLIIERTIVNYLKNGYNSLSISFGCTGGKHRSLFAVEEIEKWLILEFHNDVRVVKQHREFPN